MCTRWLMSSCCRVSTFLVVSVAYLSMYILSLSDIRRGSTTTTDTSTRPGERRNKGLVTITRLTNPSLPLLLHNSTSQPVTHSGPLRTVRPDHLRTRPSALVPDFHNRPTWRSHVRWPECPEGRGAGKKEDRPFLCLGVATVWRFDYTSTTR
jgi:hypothetical protein